MSTYVYMYTTYIHMILVYLHRHMAITFEPDTNACRYERFGYFLYVSMYPRAKLDQVHCSIRRTGIALHSQVQSPSRFISDRRYHMDPNGMSIIFNEKGRKHGCSRHSDPAAPSWSGLKHLGGSAPCAVPKELMISVMFHSAQYVLDPSGPQVMQDLSPTGRPGRPGTDKAWKETAMDRPEALIYVSFVLISCALFSKFWIEAERTVHFGSVRKWGGFNPKVPRWSF